MEVKAEKVVAIKLTESEALGLLEDLSRACDVFEYPPERLAELQSQLHTILNS